jgi:hypothetical protein
MRYMPHPLQQMFVTIQQLTASKSSRKIWWSPCSKDDRLATWGNCSHIIARRIKSRKCCRLNEKINLPIQCTRTWIDNIMSVLIDTPKRQCNSIGYTMLRSPQSEKRWLQQGVPCSQILRSGSSSWKGAPRWMMYQLILRRFREVENQC